VENSEEGITSASHGGARTRAQWLAGSDASVGGGLLAGDPTQGTVGLVPVTDGAFRPVLPEAVLKRGVTSERDHVGEDEDEEGPSPMCSLVPLVVLLSPEW